MEGKRMDKIVVDGKAYDGVIENTGSHLYTVDRGRWLVRDGGSCRAYGMARVTVQGNGYVEAYDCTTVRAAGNATVHLCGEGVYLKTKKDSNVSVTRYVLWGSSWVDVNQWDAMCAQQEEFDAKYANEDLSY